MMYYIFTEVKDALSEEGYNSVTHLKIENTPFKQICDAWINKDVHNSISCIISSSSIQLIHTYRPDIFALALANSSYVEITLDISSNESIDSFKLELKRNIEILLK